MPEFHADVPDRFIETVRRHRETIYSAATVCALYPGRRRPGNQDARPPWPPLAKGGRGRALRGNVTDVCPRRASLRRAFLVDLVRTCHTARLREKSRDRR